MELLEYQAKELFRRVGIPVLPSQRINQPRDLRELTIPYPVVLKSQVFTGGRGKAGGIKFVENTIDAMAAAQAIFHLPIMGKYPEVVLAEARYDPDREFYLAIVLDSSSRRPVLLGSQYGGERVEFNLDRMQQVIVDQEFSPFYARRLAVKMGLKGNLIQSVSSIVEKMYRLFVHHDLDLIEINPLAVSHTGELMALDGKVTLNDAALGRHPNLGELLSKGLENYYHQAVTLAEWGMNLVELDGDIGVLCTGAGLGMATVDLLHRAKGKPAGFVDLGGEYRQGWFFVPLQERIAKGLDLICRNQNIKVVLINILSSMVSCLQVAEVIAHQRHCYPDRLAPLLVVRLVGEDLPQAQALLEENGISVLDRLDDAIIRAVSLAKMPKV